MRKDVARAVRLLFRDQHEVATRSQVRAIGVTALIERERVAAGDWVRLYDNVIGLATASLTGERRLMAAVLAAGPSAVASHRSAAWLWGLVPEPSPHSVAVARSAHGRQAGIEVHRVTHPPDRVSIQRGIPCTNPLRAMVDLAAVATGPELDDALDVGLAKRLVTIEALQAEIGRQSLRGRSGAGKLRIALRRRGLIDTPHPSVLESRLLRLLQIGGIRPIGLEVAAGPEGRYRLDTLLSPVVAMEVDGYAYHGSPEQKAADERRRNRIRLDGMFLLVYTWMDVTYDGRRVLAEARYALAVHGGRRGTLAR